MRPDESYDESAVREIKEEMGIDVAVLSLDTATTLVSSINDRLSSSAINMYSLFNFHYTGHRNNVWGRVYAISDYEGPLNLQTEEVSAVVRMKVDDVLALNCDYDSHTCRTSRTHSDALKQRKVTPDGLMAVTLFAQSVLELFKD